MRHLFHLRSAGAPGPALLAAILLAWLCPAPALASGDIGCTTGWTLRHRDLTGCDNVAMLSPGNDTRVNLALLLARAPRQAAPAPRDVPRPDPLFDWATWQQWTYSQPADVGDPGHAAGEGSRCLSDAAGAAAFAAALGAARAVAAGEKAALIAARRGLAPTCTDTGAGAGALAGAAAAVRSPAGRGYLAYLQGAVAFYAGDFDTATARFGSLGGSDQPWLRETARYMLARVEVNRAQVGAYDEFGYRDAALPVAHEQVDPAEARLLEYLRAFPTGRYAGSARGLLRRVYWLGSDTPRLAAQYAALIAQPAATRGLDDAALAEEIDNKLLPTLAPADATDPVLLAVLDLQLMRGDKDAKASITRAELEAQRPRFAREPALFDHLLATYAFYVARDPREVLRLIPDAARRPGFDSVAFSRQVLRGMALDAVGDRNARGFWLEMLPGTAPPFQRLSLELAIAWHDERTGGLDRVFAAGSPVQDATLRDILLTDVAGPALLRRQAGDAAASRHERAVAQFVLLYKELTRGAWRDFVADIARVPAGAATTTDLYNFVGTADPSLGIFTAGATSEDFACPALRDTAARLAADPGDAGARLCLAEFVRLNNLDGFFLDTQPPADELGGTPTQFPGRPFSRGETYKALIAAPRTPPAARAYALFRAVNCYAPSQSNACGGSDVAPAVRKGWFQRLHRDYPTSRWAQESRYYW